MSGLTSMANPCCYGVMKPLQYAAAVSLCLSLAAPSSATAFFARVSRVHDGDTVTVTSDDGAATRVRLYGIDAPEYKQSYGREAKTALVRLVRRKTLDVARVDTDRYGRTVALLRLPDGTLVNEALVAEGAAWYYGEFCKRDDPCQHWRVLEEQARAERLGLWAQADPQRPSDWRREHKKGEWYTAPARAVRKVVRKVKVVWRSR